jgi:hypothetical protein
MTDLLARVIDIRLREQLASAKIEDEPLDPRGIAAIKAGRVKGKCLFCDRLAKRFTCGSHTCLKSYRRAWHRDTAKIYPERYSNAFYRAKKRRAHG